MPNESSSDIKYKSKIPTLRSSSHRVRQKAKNIDRNEPQPKRTSTTPSSSNYGSGNGDNGDGTMLPASIRKMEHIPYDMKTHDFNRAIILFLKSLDSTIVGDFRENKNENDGGDGRQSSSLPTLENFEVPTQSLTKMSKRGILLAQDHLSQAMHDCFFGEKENDEIDATDATDATDTTDDGGYTSLSSFIVNTFDNFVTQVVIPHLKARLVEEHIIPESSTVKFYYQRPPTLRIQPGPARAKVNRHKDKDYGHQNGELNFWIPLTNRLDTGVDLYVESEEDKGDFEPLQTDVGYASSFFGSGCSHFVNENKSQFTRVSLDFRVGIEPFFDPVWSKVGEFSVSIFSVSNFFLLLTMDKPY